MYLPKPPSDKELYSYINTNRKSFLVIGVFSFISLVTGMYLFSKADYSFWFYFFYVALCTAYFGISYAIAIFSKDFGLEGNDKVRREFLAKYDYDKPISIDVYLPSCGEDVAILANTYAHVGSMAQYSSNRFKVKVHVLDDSGKQEDELKIICEQFNFNYIQRDNKGWFKKAGNLVNAFKQTDGEFIVIFDADFCPRHDFLDYTMGYFLDSKVAIVQTPQYFSIDKSQNWIQQGAGYVQEIFYRLIQTSRDEFGGAICVGTCAVYRRKALEPFGGTALIEHSEDVHTGVNCLSLGYKIKYVPLNISKGICPETLQGFFSQQYRWCMGSMSLLTSKKFWLSPMSVMQKLCYITGFLYYITTALSVLFAPIPGILLVWFKPSHVVIYNALFSVPSLIFGLIFLRMWSTLPWTYGSLKCKIVANYAHLFALKDKLTGSIMSWNPSGNAKKNNKFFIFKYFLIFWSHFSVFILLLGIHIKGQNVKLYHFIPILFFALFNYAFSILAIIQPSNENN